MQIILLGFGIPLPRGVSENADPVVRRTAVGFCIGPDEPIPLRIGARCSRLNKPGMLIRGMVRNVVNNDLQPAFVSLRYQLIKRRQVAKYRIYICVVGDIIAEIRHRRRINGREPDGIYSQGIAYVV